MDGRSQVAIEQKDKEEAVKKSASLKRLEQEEEQEKKKKVKKDIETIQTSISFSEELLKSWQQELEEVTKMTNVDRLRLMAASAQLRFEKGRWAAEIIGGLEE